MVAKRWGWVGGEFGISRCKLLYIEWINNTVLLGNIGNYIQYPVINHHGKEYEKEYVYICITDFPDGSDGKASAYNVGDLGLNPGSGRSSGEGNGNPLQYSCLENPVDGGAWLSYSVWCRKEWDTTERLHLTLFESLCCIADISTMHQ